MKSKLGHIYLYVSDLNKSYKFYSSLLKFLDYKQITRADWGFAFINNGLSIWFEATPKNHLSRGYHRRRTGLNHIAFRVTSKNSVDKFYKGFLKKQNILTLYNTPKKFPEYGKDYYAVFFEDSDRIKLEVAYYP